MSLTCWVTCYCVWAAAGILCASELEVCAHRKQNRVLSRRAGTNTHSHLRPLWTVSPARGLWAPSSGGHSRVCPVLYEGTLSLIKCNTVNIRIMLLSVRYDFHLVFLRWRKSHSMELTCTCTFSKVATNRCVTLPACRKARPVIGQLHSWRLRVLLCLSLVMSPFVSTTLPSVKPDNSTQILQSI